MTMAKNNFNKFNKKFIVTALGVAALGFQLMQTNNVKADDIADSKTGDAPAEQNAVDTKDSSVADDSSIQKDASLTTYSANTNQTVDTETDTSSEKNINQSQDGNTDDAAKDSDEQNQDTSTSTDGSKTENTDNQVADANEQASENNGQQDTETQTNTAPAIIDTNNDGTTKNITANNQITTYLSLSATNSSGTTTSTFSANPAPKPIVNSDSTSTNLVLTIINNSDEKNDDFTMTIWLPLGSPISNSDYTNIVLSDDFNPDKFQSNFPQNTVIKYSMEDRNQTDKTVGELEADPNFKWSDIHYITITSNSWSFGTKPLAYLEPNQTITVNIPIVQKEKMESLNNGIAQIQTNFLSGSEEKQFDFNYGTVSDNKAQSKYTAVLDNGNVAPDDVQELMPDYKTGDITINAEGKEVDAGDRELLYGEKAKVNLNNIGIKDKLNNDGYSYALDFLGAQITDYTYTPEAENGLMNLSLRQVINAQDSKAKIGQDWTAAENLVSVQDNNNTILTGDNAINAVSTSISDDDGVLQDGKIAKSGSFTVTYTYNLKDGTAINKTVTVTVDPVDSGSSTDGKPSGSTDNNSGSSSSSTSSGSDSSSNSGSNNSSSTNNDFTNPVVSPDSPDNINDNERLVSTHPSDGVVSLYKLDTTKITNRSLNTATDWYSDKDMTFAGETYYRVATNEWVKASNVYVYADRNLVVQTNDTQQLVDSKGNAVTNRALLANTAWYTDRVATINGKSYYRVATNEFVPTDAVTVM